MFHTIILVEMRNCLNVPRGLYKFHHKKNVDVKPSQHV